MAKSRRGATRNPVVKPKQPIVWQNVGRYIAIVVGFILVAAMLIYTRQSQILPITRVSIEGEFKHVEKAVLVDVIKPHTTGSFLSVNVDKISDAAEALPWIRQVQVSRVWPDGLHLIVQEQEPVARWHQAGYVNNAGELFPESKQKVDQSMPLLKGPEDSEQLLTQRYLTMNKALKPLGLAVQTLTMNDRRAWQLTLNNKIKVVLGRADSEQRFQRFLQVYKHNLQQYQTHIAEMDMRYPNGLSVIWKAGQKPDFKGTIS